MVCATEFKFYVKGKSVALIAKQF